VYVVDDHEPVRAGLVELLSRVGGYNVVGSSGSAVDAVRQIVALRPDVAVVDGHLSDHGGLEVVRALSGEAPEVASVVLTTGVGASWGPVDAAAAGAAAFVLKSLVDFPLVEVVGRVAAGERLLT